MALRGIGKEMALHITEILQTGTLRILEDLLQVIPGSLVEVMRIAGIGPKRARRLWDVLGVKTVDALEEAARGGKVAEVEGFGTKTQMKILKGVAHYRASQGRMRLADAEPFALSLLEHMRKSPAVAKAEIAGSFRRRQETIGDLDLLVTAEDAATVMEHFVKFAGIAEVTSRGSTKTSVVLDSGLEVDVRAVPQVSYGAALLYFTGSKQHNIELRQRAIERHWKLSEYGLFQSGGGIDEDPTVATGKMIAGKSEAEVYRALGLAWIPPELREARGEIDAAESGRLPELITLEDIRGDLQMHSTWSDGQDSIEAMLRGCLARGYDYCALTDHSKALAMTGGMDAKRLRAQWQELEEITLKFEGIHVLRGMEVDILADGTLDLEDELLEELDLVVVSVHSRFELPVARQTKRILRALQHPHVHILGHPTGRLINKRPPLDFDLHEVLSCAKEHGVAVELNAHPARLDLHDIQLKQARDMGVKIAINTDAHQTEQLSFMRYGIDQARRGWLSKEDVLNTLSLDSLMQALKR
jgi:DNA polymerase (family X)